MCKNNTENKASQSRDIYKQIPILETRWQYYTVQNQCIL